MMDGKDLFQRPSVLDHGRDPTRAKPPPWFVGNGTGLMIAVVTIVALLIAIRAASMVWLIERGWAWTEPWWNPAHSREIDIWFVAEPYPRDALLARYEGTTRVGWDVDTDGRPTLCVVTRSSGRASLDRATCRVVMRHLEPQAGWLAPATRHFVAEHSWFLRPGPWGVAVTPARARDDEAAWINADDYPPDAIRREQEGTVRLRWIIGIEGRVRDCRAVESSGVASLDRAGCAALERSGRYVPAKDAAGSPVPTYKTRRIVWRLPE